jgi:hypothetical protein
MRQESNIAVAEQEIKRNVEYRRGEYFSVGLVDTSRLNSILHWCLVV